MNDFVQPSNGLPEQQTVGGAVVSLTDIKLAMHAVRVHCPVAWPEGLRCNNCGSVYPWLPYRWGHRILESVGWSEQQILALDRRTGPWF